MINSSYQATCAFLDAADGDHRNDLAAAVPGVRQEDRPPAVAPAAD